MDDWTHWQLVLGSVGFLPKIVIMEEKYILSLDIGTTTIRSFIYNSRTEIVGKAVDQVFIGFVFKPLKLYYRISVSK